MQLKKVKLFRGPNVYADLPVLCFSLTDFEQYDTSGAAEKLSRFIPVLGDLAKQDRAPGEFAALFEQACVALQNMAGASLALVEHAAPGSAKSNSGEYLIRVPYEYEAVGEAAAFLAYTLITDAPENLSARIEEFLAYAVKEMLPVQDRAIIAAAHARDIPSYTLAGRVIALGQGCYQQRLCAMKTSTTNIVSNDLAANKDYSRRIFMDIGLPVPKYVRVRRSRDAVKAAEDIGYPVVVKPNNGNMGGGVSIGMKNKREVRDAYRRAREHARSVLVEEIVAGADFRILVVDGKFCAASKRVPAHVVGDGVHSIEKLVEIINQDPKRGSGPTKFWTRITLEEQADRLIAGHGYTRDSVPGAGEVIWLRRNANTSDGGTSVDVTDEICDDNIRIAERAAKVIGLDIAGVDFLTEDISVSMWDNGGKICEINSRPGIRKHVWPAQGQPRDVTSPILDMLFPKVRPTRIPVVALIGVSSDLLARKLNEKLTAAGYHVGMVVDGVTSSGANRVADQTLTGPEAARRVLLDPDVNVAVMHLSIEDVMDHGLGCDRFDLTAIFDEEHIDSASGSTTISKKSVRDVLNLVKRKTLGEVLSIPPGSCHEQLSSKLFDNIHRH